jgi:hypothetical protein
MEALVERPIQLQVIAPVLTNFYHCMHCEQIFAQAGIGQRVHQEEREQYPPHVLEEYERLRALIFALAHRYGGRIRIRVVDPQSLEGFFKSLRYWVRTYPTFIIDGREKVRGWDRQALEARLRASLGSG